jgi:hypothetical protein
MRISGVLPRLSEAALPGEPAEWLRKVLVDIALGEKVISGFINANDGIYHQPQMQGERVEFRIDLPAYLEDAL